jgi:hypothetical protein
MAATDLARGDLMTLIRGNSRTAGLLRSMETLTGCSAELLLDASQDSSKEFEVLLRIHHATEPKGRGVPGGMRRNLPGQHQRPGLRSGEGASRCK